MYTHHNVKAPVPVLVCRYDSGVCAEVSVFMCVGWCKYMSDAGGFFFRFVYQEVPEQQISCSRWGGSTSYIIHEIIFGRNPFRQSQCVSAQTLQYISVYIRWEYRRSATVKFSVWVCVSVCVWDAKDVLFQSVGLSMGQCRKLEYMTQTVCRSAR